MSCLKKRFYWRNNPEQGIELGSTGGVVDHYINGTVGDKDNNDGLVLKSFNKLDLKFVEKVSIQDNLNSVDVNLTSVNPTGTTRLNIDGHLYATKVFNAVYNDYAECFECDRYIETNTIVQLGFNGMVIPANSMYDLPVIGIVSNSYGFILNGTEEEIKKYAKVAVGMCGTLDVLCNVDFSYDNINKFVALSDVDGVGRIISKDQYYDERLFGQVVGKVIGESELNSKYHRVLIMNT